MAVVVSGGDIGSVYYHTGRVIAGVPTKALILGQGSGRPVLKVRVEEIQRYPVNIIVYK